MECPRFTALWLILLLSCGTALEGQVLYHPLSVPSGSFGMMVYRSPQGYLETRETAPYSLSSPGGEASVSGKIWRPQAQILPWLYVGLFAVPSTWDLDSLVLEIDDERIPIAVESRDYISETIPLTRTLTGIRTNTGQDRRSQSQRLAEILATFDPKDLVSQSRWEPPIKVEYRETSFFGDRRIYEYSDGTTARSIHYGHDWAAPRGTTVYTPASGRVVLADHWIVTGKTVIIVTAPGVYNLFYHLGELKVQEGQWVNAGDPIGTLGSTGLSTGPHLHWEVRVNGVAVKGDEILGETLLDKRPLINMIEGHIEKGR
jgi:hypothetical protein